MSEFSQEYVEEYTNGEIIWDFSIEDEFEQLEQGQYKPKICEGYGFVAIANRNGECHLIFNEDNNVVFVPYHNLNDYFSS